MPIIIISQLWAYVNNYLKKFFIFRFFGYPFPRNYESISERASSAIPDMTAAMLI